MVSILVVQRGGTEKGHTPGPMPKMDPLYRMRPFRSVRGDLVGTGSVVKCDSRHVSNL
jgi:hypothetical protein